MSSASDRLSPWRRAARRDLFDPPGPPALSIAEELQSPAPLLAAQPGRHRRADELRVRGGPLEAQRPLPLRRLATRLHDARAGDHLGISRAPTWVPRVRPKASCGPAMK